MPGGHRHGMACSEELRHEKRDVGVAELPSQVFTLSEQLFHREVVGLNASLRLLPLRRIDRVWVPAQVHQLNDVREEHFVRTMLEPSRFGSP